MLRFGGGGRRWSHWAVDGFGFVMDSGGICCREGRSLRYEASEMKLKKWCVVAVWRFRIWSSFFESATISLLDANTTAWNDIQSTHACIICQERIKEGSCL